MHGIMEHLTFSEMVHLWRFRNGLSTREAGKLLGVSKTTIANWENGSRSPHYIHFNRLMEEMEISKERGQWIWDWIWGEN